MADRPVQVIGALVSGTGRSVLNLHQAAERGEARARMGVVIGTRADLPALDRAASAGLPTAVVPPEPASTFHDRMDAALLAHGVTLVCLCGYLRQFRVDKWRGRALNIHPALLPSFGGAGMFGARVHRAVLAAGSTESGCTVHMVDDQYDHGPIVLQLRCPVLKDDSAESLAERVFALERVAYPLAVAEVAKQLSAPSLAPGSS